MAATALNSEEKIGLGVAALGHVALALVLMMTKQPAPLPPVERVSVTLSDEVGAVSTSPDPTANPAPDKGPQLGEPAPEAAPEPEPVPAPKASAAPAPAPRPTTAPPQKVPPRQAQTPPSKWPFSPPGKTPPTPNPQKGKTPPTARTGASVLDPNYGKGIDGGSGKDKTPPASRASAQVVASWDSSIKAKVLAKMRGCPVSGLDAGSLRATVNFSLTRTGGIEAIEDFNVGGITDANRTQARPFKDCIARAIRLAAPFTGMPAEFYDQWKSRRLNISGK